MLCSLNPRSARASVEVGNAGVGPHGVLAPADAVTAAVLADLAPGAVQPHLPIQVRKPAAVGFGTRVSMLQWGSSGCRIWNGCGCRSKATLAAL